MHRGPSFSIDVITFAGLDPSPTSGRPLAFPKPSLALEVIHCEVGGEERIAAVASGRSDEDDWLASRHAADTMDDQQTVQTPSLRCLVGLPENAGRRQRLVMAELELEYCPLGAVGTNLAEEADDPPGTRLRGYETSQLVLGVEGIGRQTYLECHLSRR